MRLLLLLLPLMNLAAFAAFYADKQAAIRGQRRISEQTLLLLAALGGSAGALLGRAVFRHKTRHAAFTLKLWVLMILQGVFLAYVLWKAPGLD
jgi:uncharacterized membrane protein YsdA (DUF1294 family)